MFKEWWFYHAPDSKGEIDLCLFVRVRFSAYTFGIRIEPHPSPQHSLTSTFLVNVPNMLEAIRDGCSSRGTYTLSNNSIALFALLRVQVPFRSKTTTSKIIWSAIFWIMTALFEIYSQSNLWPGQGQVVPPVPLCGTGKAWRDFESWTLAIISLHSFVNSFRSTLSLLAKILCLQRRRRWFPLKRRKYVSQTFFYGELPTVTTRAITLAKPSLWDVLSRIVITSFR